MGWRNEPTVWQADDGRLTVSVDPGTDCWRVTAHDVIQDDAPFYYREVAGDFTARVSVRRPSLFE